MLAVVLSLVVRDVDTVADGVLLELEVADDTIELEADVLSVEVRVERSVMVAEDDTVDVCVDDGVVTRQFMNSPAM